MKKVVIVLSWPRCCQVVMTPARKQIPPQQIFLCQKKVGKRSQKIPGAFSETQRTGWHRMPGANPLKRWAIICGSEKVLTKMAIPKIWFLWGFAVVLNKGGEMQFWQRELDKIQIIVQHFYKVKGLKSFSPLHPHSVFQLLFGFKNLFCIWLSSAPPVALYTMMRHYRYSSKATWRDFHSVQI